MYFANLQSSFKNDKICRFIDHYKTNRAPLLISMNPEFLSSEFKVKGLRLFLKYLTSYKVSTKDVQRKTDIMVLVTMRMMKSA